MWEIKSSESEGLFRIQAAFHAVHLMSTSDLVGNVSILGWSTSQRTKLTANTQHTRHIVCIKSGVQKSESHRGSCQARKLQCSDHHLRLHHAALTLEARSPSDWSWIFRNLKQCGQRHRRISHCYSVCYILHIVHVCKPRFQWTETLRRIKCHEVVNVWCSGLSSTNLRGVPCRQRPGVRLPTCQVDPSCIKLSPKGFCHSTSTCCSHWCKWFPSKT